LLKIKNKMKKSLLALLSFAVLSMTACKPKPTDPGPDPEPIDSTEVTLTGDINSDMTLDASKKYTLKGFVYVLSGATLHIPAGTKIMGDKATKGTLIISRGGKIDANGTSSSPIVFTSSQAAGARTPGDWGGIIMLGKAQVNATGGEAKIEGGLTPTDASKEHDYIWYGGTDNNDNSGTLKYVRIEFAGIAYSVDNEINGLTMGGVGAGTTISYVQVYRSGDDAFEWFGGTVNCDHLLATYSWDDDFDTDNGFAGRVQFGCAHRAKTIADQSKSNGFESDNDAAGSSNSPKTAAMFSNMTIIGPSTNIATALGFNALFDNGAQIRRNSTVSILNSIIIGFPTGLYIDGSASTTNAINGTLKFRNNIVAGCDKKFKSNATWADSTYWNALASLNMILDSSQKVKMVDPNKFPAVFSTSPARPNYLLQDSSPAISGADFSGTSGFENVSYRGAFDASTDWTSGWATFEAETTEY
jgi:hypothetical protein